MSTAEKLASIDPATARRLLEDGYFDAAFYRRTAHLPSEMDAFEHYFLQGVQPSFEPNIAFDTAWYLEQNPDVTRGGFHPLLHYALIGEALGRDPSALFDVRWYAQTYQTRKPLAHYLAHRFGPYSPIPEFDAAYYLSAYPDVPTARMDPFLHYMHFGFREFRKPSADFNPRFYANRFPAHDRGANPIVDVRRRRREGRSPETPRSSPTSFSEVKAHTRAGPMYERLEVADGPARPDVLALAYYLPQFHRVAENDAWWGEGFTEWSQLARGQPRFSGHYQPRIPGAFGFYDLDDPDVLRAQARQAKAAGLHGFVFYYYDFDGRRLLEKPLEQFLATPDIDIAFCLMWANENWTRRWDGLDNEILIAQSYEERNERRRCAEFVRHFRDPRYLRLDGRPLLMVYRASLIPQCARTIARWRRIFSEQFGETPIFVMAQTFDDIDPEILGFDVAIEFPPHKLTKGLPQVYETLDIFDEKFEADVFAYADLVDASLKEPASKYPLIKTAVPHWDNDARRQGQGLALVGSTPIKYERWLAALVARARARPTFGRPLVCVNAWNEWSEGAYLEPDVFFGWAYLNATRRAICGDARRRASLVVAGDRGDSSLSGLANRFAAAFGFEIAWGANASTAAAVAALVGAGASSSIREWARAGLRTVWLFDETRDDAEANVLKAADVVVFADAPSKQRTLANARIPDAASFVVAPPFGDDADGADRVLRALRDLLTPGVSRISVCVIHRGTAPQARASLNAIFAQTHPVWEIIVLDESASPASFDEIDACAHESDRDVTVAVDDQSSHENATSWRRAVAMASGDLIWITDTDSVADVSFLARVAAPMCAEARVVVACCDIRQVEEDLSRGPSPLSARKSSLGFVDATFDAKDFVARLAAGQDRPRAGCALWRREALALALADFDEGGEVDLGAIVAAAAAKPLARMSYVADVLLQSAL